VKETPQPFWTLWSREKSLALAGNRTPDLQTVASLHKLGYLVCVIVFIQRIINAYFDTAL
jgi:hypothetical protein